MSARTVRIALLAIAGLLVAAALGAAASRITSNQVGLYGEPPSVGSELVAEPAGTRAKPKHRRGEGRAGERGADDPPATGVVEPPPPAETTTPPPAETTTPPPPVDDSSAEPSDETTGADEPEAVETEDGDSDDD